MHNARIEKNNKPSFRRNACDNDFDNKIGNIIIYSAINIRLQLSSVYASFVYSTFAIQAFSNETARVIIL